MECPTRTSGVFLDYLALTASFEAVQLESFLSSIMPGCFISHEVLNAGWQGYKCSARVLADGYQVGLLAWGGDSQRGRSYVSLTGDACRLIHDVTQVYPMATRYLGEPRLNRVDIAADVLRGRSFASVLKAAEQGMFTTPGRGRPPKTRIVTPGPGSDGGSTLYVGDRTGSKFIRVYEKAWELFEQGLITYERLNQDRSWLRFEVEYKSKGCELSWAVLEALESAFTSACPMFQVVMPDVSLCDPRITVPELQAQSLDQVLANIRTQYGNTLFSALHAMGGDAEQLLSKIIGVKHSERIRQLGLLRHLQGSAGGMGASSPHGKLTDDPRASDPLSVLLSPESVSH